MDNMIYLSGCRMGGLAENLQVIASNLANANTPGFKGTVCNFDAALAAAGTQASDPAGGGAALTWPRLAGYRLDCSPGPIRRTERPLDLAIRGRGFFEVDTPDGPRYTRKGRAYVDAQGELKDGAGNRFASDSGTLRIPAGATEIGVGPDGQVSADGRALGRLKVVDVPDTKALVCEGEATFRNDGAAATPAANSEVIQGAVEESNVNAAREMVALINLMRAYEANAQIVRKVDGTNGQLIKTA